MHAVKIHPIHIAPHKINSILIPTHGLDFSIDLHLSCNGSNGIGPAVITQISSSTHNQLMCIFSDSKSPISQC